MWTRIPHPMTIVVGMGEAITESTLPIKAFNRDRANRIERLTQIALEESSEVPNSRALAIELSWFNWFSVETKIGLERSRFLLNFALENLALNGTAFNHAACKAKLEEARETLLSRTKFSLSSIEMLNFEYDSHKSRFETQNLIVSNLIAQEDMNITLKMAQTSQDIAGESRKDSFVMRIIAILGMIFLPATFTAVCSAPSNASRRPRRLTPYPDLFLYTAPL